jgi:predicted dienelactone hydrolase
MVFWKRRRWLGLLTRLIALVASGVAVFIGALWIEHHFETILPAPTGPYRVGRVHLVWSEPPPAPTEQQMIVWMWYPAAGHADAGKTSPFLPTELSAAVIRNQGWLINLITRDVSKVRTHSIDDAPPAPAPHPFPVLLMRGGASAPVSNYTTLAENLASHGYVVVGFDIPYRTKTVVMANGAVATRLPENDPELAAERHDDATIQRLIDAWTHDLSRAVDHLTRLNASDSTGLLAGRLDLSRIGVFGHSFGGTAAAQFCANDPRCRAGVDIDGRMFGSSANATITQPFMFLLGDHHREDGAESSAIMHDIQAVYGRLPAATRKWVAIPGANHFFFSDDGAWLKSHLVIGALRRLSIIQIDGPQQLALTASNLRSFFDTALPPPAPRSP